MQRFEYLVVPAPRRGEKARGVKSVEDRFALALTGLMNRMGAEGWDYVRADTLPCDERVGLTGTKTAFQNMLVFRRAATGEGAAGHEPAAVPVLAVPDDHAPLPPLRLGAPEAPEGPAPALGPARPGLAAE